MDPDAVVEELYALEPGEFTARRDALAAQARRDGDPDLAKQVRALRRPTAAAAALNRLAREAGDELAGYLAVGERLREAQAALRGSELRELGQQRQRTAARLVERADALAGGLSDAVRQEVDETLRAAVADAAASQVVASGQLTKALSYAGFGEVDITAATATPLRPVSEAKPDPIRPATKRAAKPTAATKEAPREDEPQRARRPAPSAGGPTAADRLLAQRREQAAAALADAERAVAQARQAADAAQAAQDDSEQAQSAAEQQVDALREQLAQARFAVRDAQRRASAAASGLAGATKTLTATEKTLDRARDRLAHLKERSAR
jgi:hypothetical protein